MREVERDRLRKRTLGRIFIEPFAKTYYALSREGRVLFEALRRHRLALAREEGVPPYVIASDRTLREIALLQPQSLEELELAHGIGPAKREKYGADLLAVVRGEGAK